MSCRFLYPKWSRDEYFCAISMGVSADATLLQHTTTAGCLPQTKIASYIKGLFVIKELV